MDVRRINSFNFLVWFSKLGDCLNVELFYSFILYKENVDEVLEYVCLILINVIKMEFYVYDIFFLNENLDFVLDYIDIWGFLMDKFVMVLVVESIFKIKDEYKFY